MSGGEDTDEEALEGVAAKDAPLPSFVCALCPQVFNQATSLRRHVLVHLNGDQQSLEDEEYECNICGKRYYCVNQFTSHMIRCHQATRPVNGNGVEKRTNDAVDREMQRSKRILSRYALKNSDRNVFFDCDVCRRRFYTKQGIIGHTKTHMKRPYRCKGCGKCFLSRQRIKQHRQKFHATEFYGKLTSKTIHSCKPAPVRDDPERMLASGFDKKSPANGETEIRSSEPVTRSKTNELRRADEQPAGVRVTAGDDERTSASRQREYTSVRQQLRINEEDSAPVKRYECSICIRRFYTEHTMQLHYNTHALPSMRRCASCNFATSNQMAFTVHRCVRKLGGRPKEFVCAICERAFFTKNTMEMHVKTHTT